MARWEERRRREKQAERGRPVDRANLPWYMKDTNPLAPIEQRGKGKDWGYSPRDYGESEDAATRRAWPGVRLRSTYLQITGGTPELRPDDRAGAWVMVRRIDAALEKGGWTKNENRRLHGMREKWLARANGQDLRFRVMGNKSGGMNEGEREKFAILKSFEAINKLVETEGRQRGLRMTGSQVVREWARTNRQLQDEGE